MANEKIEHFGHGVATPRKGVWKMSEMMRAPRTVLVFAGDHDGFLLRRRFGGGAQQILVRSHPVAVAANVDDVAVVQNPVDEGGGHEAGTGAAGSYRTFRLYCP